MAQTLWDAPSANAYQTTLNGTISDSQTTITLASITNLTAPGVLVIDRQDGSGNDTPALREYITFTGISGNDITGVTRGVAGSTAQDHTSGALVEAIVSITHWRDLVAFLQAEHDATGKHVISTATINYAEIKNLAVTSEASINHINFNSASAPSLSLWGSQNLFVTNTATIGSTQATNLVVNSTASINDLYVQTLHASGLSVAVNTRGQFFWTKSGALPTSLPTTTNLTPMPFQRVHQDLNILNVWMGVYSAPSLAQLQGDILYASSPTGAWNTIFAVKPTIDIGEYSTDTAAGAASIQLTSLASGLLLRPAILSPGGAGYMSLQLQVQTRG